ncbi:hypothetical protein GJ744_000106 [Endocarpon pusillum]|uniref:Uncharacterized protein n=1 Tax=Endocarpon pusillum TaxID=364733 RepID=A0A8H7AWA1_9EURO|nr:hypothetical protein GJ744_000106 [Endocarpon pusillum]
MTPFLQGNQSCAFSHVPSGIWIVKLQCSGRERDYSPFWNLRNYYRVRTNHIVMRKPQPRQTIAGMWTSPMKKWQQSEAIYQMLG